MSPPAPTVIEAQLRALVDHLPEAVAFVDCEGRYVEVNAVFCDMAGAPRHEVLGRTADAFTPPRLAERFHAQDRLVLTTGETHTFEEWTTSRGLHEPVLLRATKSPVRDADGALLGVLMVLGDVTAERSAAIISRTERELARALLSQTSRDELLAAILDLAVELPGLDAGAIYARRPGGGFELVHHRHLSPEFIARVSRFPPEGEQARLLELGRVVVSFPAPARFVFEPRIVTSESALSEGLRSSVVLPMQVDGETAAFLNLASHFVEHLSELLLTSLEALQLHFTNALRRLEAERRAALERSNFVNAFDTIRDFVFVVGEDGRIVHHNRAVLDELGYERGELIGAPIGAVHPPEMRVGAARIVDEMIAGRLSSCPLPLRAKDGGEVYVDTRAVRGEWNGRPAILGISRDIRTQREAETALVRAREEARATSAAKSEFLANMSHEIRTPMNAIIGLTQLALDLALPPEPREYVSQAYGAAVSLLGILDDVLDFSKIEARKLEIEAIPLALCEVLDRVRNLAELRAREKGMSLEISIADDVPPGLVGDPLRLAQVLNNLVGNAIKFSSRGVVRVSVSRVPPTDDRPRVRFEVIDEGAGIAPERIEEIFRPFTQADGSVARRFGGTGLGLAISHHLVERMGGTLGVESELGVGSRFFFEACFAECAPPSPRLERNALETPPSLVGLRVLLVEDNLVNQLLGVKTLERSGMHPTAASDGAEALRVLDAHPDDFDVVLMDVQMPVLDGIEATRRLRADSRFDALPVIAVTAHAFAEDRRRCLDAGMQDYISKPFDLSHLYRVLCAWRER